MANKYGAKKVYYDGKEFDSRKEKNRYQELKILERVGQISNLELQKTFDLIPAQYEPSTEVYTKGKNKGKPKQGKLIEKAVTYKADFVYIDENGKTIVEDCKGYKGGGAYALFTIKRKLLLYKYGIKIKEV